MTNSRYRCAGCKAYFPADQVARSNGVQRFCSSCAGPGHGSNGRSAVKPLVTKPDYRSKAGGVTPVRRDPPAKKPKDEIPTAVRRDVLARDGHRCVMCRGANPNLHHVHYRSEGVDHSPHNLVALCVKCHNPIVHANKRKWQPICLAYIWLRDVEGRRLTLREVEKLVARLGA